MMPNTLISYIDEKLYEELEFVECSYIAFEVSGTSVARG